LRRYSALAALSSIYRGKAAGKNTVHRVTGHHDPSILRKCIERFDFDTVLMPVNPGEPQYKSFLSGVLPLARERGMGIIGMKVYFRGFASRLRGMPAWSPSCASPFPSP